MPAMSRRSPGSRRRARRRAFVALAAIALVALAAGVLIARQRAGGAPLRGDAGAPSTADHPAVAATPVQTSPKATPVARVVSGGDVMTDRGPKAYAQAHGTDAVLAGIAPVFRKGDVAWVNLEGVVSTLGHPVPDKNYTFEGPPGMAAALSRAGIRVVSLGNNHAVDYGPAALVDCLRLLRLAGVQAVGAGGDVASASRAAVVTTRSGATVGFLAWNDISVPGFTATRTRPGVVEAYTDVARMKRAIRSLAKRVDYVVVGFHWGIEYAHYETSQQMREAHAAVEAGADLVIGNHPHVMEGIEAYRHRLIFYSLGDLVFDHKDVDSGRTILVDARLTPEGVTATLVPVYSTLTGIPSVQHGVAARTILAAVREYCAPFGTKVVIHGDTATVRAGKG